MDKFKFISFLFIVIIIFGGIGYWAFTSIDSGSEYAKRSEQRQIEEEAKNQQKEAEQLAQEDQKIAEEEAEQLRLKEEEEKLVKPVVLKYQSLISELQELVNDNINMKLKSKGTRVGTVQNFLNVYNNTTKKVDNVYGAGTIKDVAAFQKAVGLKADGLAGPATYQKMIDWLKTQG